MSKKENILILPKKDDMDLVIPKILTNEKTSECVYYHPKIIIAIDYLLANHFLSQFSNMKHNCDVFFNAPIAQLRLYSESKSGHKHWTLTRDVAGRDLLSFGKMNKDVGFQTKVVNEGRTLQSNGTNKFVNMDDAKKKIDKDGYKVDSILLINNSSNNFFWTQYLKFSNQKNLLPFLHDISFQLNVFNVDIDIYQDFNPFELKINDFRRLMMDSRIA